MMCAKLLKKSRPKRILVVSLTNIGDVVLSCPVLDILKRDFPKAQMDVVVGPKAVSLFENNPNFTIKVFDKQASFENKSAWFWDLYLAHYDCVIDLRRTALAFFLMPKYATPLVLGSVGTGHKKDMHLNRLGQIYKFDAVSQERHAIITTKADEQFFEESVMEFSQGQDFVVIAAGAADSAKRWHAEGFAAVADYLAVKSKVVFVGDVKDVDIINDIQGRMKAASLSLAGKMNLRQLACVLKKSSWALTHDSGVMHLASYFNVPVLALWGPTSLQRYAPWSAESVIVRRNGQCTRCQDPKSKAAHNCMSFITVEDVILAIEEMQK
jgi:heptosyltransferase-2